MNQLADFRVALTTNGQSYTGHADLNSMILRVIPGRLAVLGGDILSIKLSAAGELAQKSWCQSVASAGVEGDKSSI